MRTAALAVFASVALVACAKEKRPPPTRVLTLGADASVEELQKELLAHDASSAPRDAGRRERA